jgi:hypothetical protein
MFCAPGLVSCGTKDVGSRFHVLCSRTRFRPYRGRPVPFSCFALPNSFSVVSRISHPVFMFGAPGLIFGGIEGVGSRFHFLCIQNHFRRCRVRRVPFFCFARSDSFSALSSASGPVFMFCPPGLVFDCTEGVGSRFHVLRSRTLFLRYRGCQVPFSCFALPDSFSRVPGASGPVFLFWAPGIIFDDTEGVGPVFLFCVLGLIFDGTEGDVSRFHVLSSRTRFRRCRGRRVPFSCFALPNSFSAVLRASGPVFMFCTPDSFSVVPWASGPVFKFCAPGLFFGCTEGVKSRFYVFRSRRCFRRYRGCRVPFSCFALLDSFSTIPRASGPVLLFCVPRLIFGGTEGVESRFHVLRSRTRFQRYRGHWVPFSCFALSDSFSAVPRASRSVFKFSATGHVFGGTEGIGSRFHV